MLKRETRLGDTAPGLLSHAFYRRTNPEQSSIIGKKRFYFSAPQRMTPGSSSTNIQYNHSAYAEFTWGEVGWEAGEED